MNFLAPAAFLFAFTLPVVVVFYLLKRKRVARVVASTLLWQKFLAETQASAPFQKLRRNWLLILQLLMLLLAILALARPYFAAKTGHSRLRVLIIDASASMQAVDENPSRFEVARKQALAWVDSLRDEDKMVVLQVAANTEVKQSETSDKSALRRAILACQAVDSPTRLLPALKMAESLIRDHGKESNPEIHLFSDGAVPDLADFGNHTLPLIYHRIGHSANNLGITALDARANPEDAGQRALYVSVGNYSTNQLQTDLELSFDGKLLETRPLTIPAGQSSAQVFVARQTHDGVFTVRSTLTDDLAVDNQASIVSLLPQPVKVLLVTAGNKFLERALRAAPNVSMAVAGDCTDTAAGFDFVVLDGITPSVWPTGNILAIHVGNTNWFAPPTALEAPSIVDWRATHPVLRYVGFDNVQIARSLATKTPTWAVSLVDAPQAPLILAGELGRQRILWIGFDPLDSNWPLRVSFPIFIANAADWLNPASVRSAELLVRAGDPFRYGLTAATNSAQVVLPGGAVEQLTVDPKATELIFGDTFRQGVYRLRVGTNDTQFCVNLLDAAESNILPRDTINLGTYSAVTATQTRRANLELWRWIAAAALLVLLFEWWYYHRRTV